MKSNILVAAFSGVAFLLTNEPALAFFVNRVEPCYLNYYWKLDQSGGRSWRLRFQENGTAQDGTVLIRRMDTGAETKGTWQIQTWGQIELQDANEESLTHVTLWFYPDNTDDATAGIQRTGFTWSDSKSGGGGYGGRMEAVSAEQATAVSPATPTATPWVAVFAREFSKASGWATLPLSNTVPGTIRDEIATIQESLKDEATKAPQASAQAYGCADLICRNLIFELDDRDNTLQQNKQNAAGKLTDAWMSAWAAKSTRYRAVLRANFDQFVAAVRQSEKPKQPVPSGMVASIDLPPVPAAAGMPASDFNVDSNNPLNRGAYDRHPIWWSPWW